MKYNLNYRLMLALSILTTLVCNLPAASWDPAAADYSGHKGKTLYVSKLGDNSDGTSWAKAFHTIQAALSAVPDDNGGHQVIIRPDHYVEANLAPAFRGAAGAYNALIGDFDGSLGSGAKGWVLLDCRDPEKGFKSWDWWGPFRSADDQWLTGNNKERFRHMYSSSNRYRMVLNGWASGRPIYSRKSPRRAARKN